MTVKRIQLLLAYLGYEVNPDGILGPQTEAAVRAFQKEFSELDVDGVAGEATQEALRAAVGANWHRPNDDHQQDEPGVTDTNVGGTDTFWDGIPNFVREEFKCKCGGRYCNGYPAEPRRDLVRLAQAARTHFGVDGIVISGLRCKQHNANEGGVEGSQHMYGEACDIKFVGKSANEVLDFFLKQPGVRYAYKINATNVHFDVPKGTR